MDFGGALHCMLGGDKCFRQTWARDVYISIQYPDDHSKMTRQYIYITSEWGTVPWNPEHEDLLAKDWVMFGS
jgi:Protein of unknown function (DUF2829)